jgi:hypothetical protein
MCCLGGVFQVRPALTRTCDLLIRRVIPVETRPNSTTQVPILSLRFVTHVEVVFCRSLEVVHGQNTDRKEKGRGCWGGSDSQTKVLSPRLNQKKETVVSRDSQNNSGGGSGRTRNGKMIISGTALRLPRRNGPKSSRWIDCFSRRRSGRSSILQSDRMGLMRRDFTIHGSGSPEQERRRTFDVIVKARNSEDLRGSYNRT